MSGASPDPSQPAREPDAVARLQLTQALQRAQYAIAWERAWPASGPDFERRRAVSGGVLGRIVAGAAVPGTRDRHRPVRPRGAGGILPVCAVSLADPRRGVEPARPRHRHSPSPGDRADRYALDQGPDRAGAVAGAARAHAGLDQADPRRPAVAAASDPRSLGAARAGHGDAGGRLFRRRRRAHAADCRGVRLERRAGPGQRPGRCLGDPAGLYRQAAGHSVRQPRCGFARQRSAVAGAVGQHAAGALQRRHDRCRGRRRRDRGRAERAGAEGHQRTAFQDRGRRHRACPRAGRPAAVALRGHARPRADHFAGQGSGTPGPRLAADVLQARGRLRRHRSARAIRRPQRGCGQGN